MHAITFNIGGLNHDSRIDFSALYRVVCLSSASLSLLAPSPPFPGSGFLSARLSFYPTKICAKGCGNRRFRFQIDYVCFEEVDCSGAMSFAGVVQIQSKNSSPDKPIFNPFACKKKNTYTYIYTHHICSAYISKHKNALCNGTIEYNIEMNWFRSVSFHSFSK